MGSGGQIKTGAWDPEEDDLLYYWQSKVGNKWSEVAKHIPGRTGQQCAQRWRHKVNPNIRRDKWTAEEDAKLIELVKTFGVGRWAEIARNCDGRTDQQCMGRWRRHLDPSIRRDSWSAEEDAKLRQLHAQYGTSWSRISKNLKGRTSQQCRARWHQINNTRSKSCGSGGAAAPVPATAAAGGSSGGGRQASGRKPASAKRRTSRRRHDSSCSEDEEELEEEDCWHEDNDDADEAAAAAAAAAVGEEQQHVEVSGGGGRSHSGSGSGSQGYAEQDQQQDYASAVAAAAAAAAAGYGYGAAELQQPWVASLAAGMIHGALASAADPAAASASEQQYQAEHQQQQQHPGGEEADGEGSEDDAGDDDDADVGRRSSSSRGGGSAQQPPIGRIKSLPSKLGGAAARAAAAAGRGLTHTGSLPSNRPVQSSSCMSPGALFPAQCLHGSLNWSPSRLLLSPQRGGRGRGAAAGVHVGRDVNEEEAAGAETLLEMATLLQQESCELQPEQLPLPAYTPPKRPAGSRLEEHLPEGLSPSPYKRARSSRLFADEDEDDDLAGEDRRRGTHHQHSRHAAAAAEGDDQPQPQVSPAVAAAAASDRHRRNGSIRHYRVPHAKAAAAAVAAADGDEALDAAADAAGGDGGSFLGDMGFRGAGLHSEHADAAGRPSNASSLTGLQAPEASAAAAAAAAVAAVFMSPPPAARGSRLAPPGSATITPNRPGAQHNVMGLLGSPMFERMVGCATPPSAGRTQPSAATLAALQSPQPSHMPEPFWTPFTGLFQDALFARGTSATPDLPSAGKRLPRGLFSPAGPRSGSASGGKVAPRRGLLHGVDVSSPTGPSAHDTEEDKLGSQPSGGGSAERPSAVVTDAETGPSPAAACGVNPPLSQVHHRVVRRLDQHEAWGTSRASPSKQGRGADSSSSSSKREGQAAGGTGLSMFSPVKKQRVPLFNESSTIKVGATPSKPDAPDDQLLPIAPLKHTLPEASSSDAQQRQQQNSPQERLAAAAASSFLHGRSPLGVKTRDRPPAAAAPAAPAAAVPQPLRAAAAQPQLRDASVLQQQHDDTLSRSFRQHSQLLELEHEQQQAGHASEQGQGQPHAAGADAAEGQGLSSPAFERAGSINHRPLPYDEPDTPVNVADTADSNTSCSGTPNTPAGMRADATGGAGQLVSPSEYVTPPQHRLRASRPLAPLHKDCLIAAATRSLADGLAAQQQQCAAKQQASSSLAARAAAGGAGGAGADSPGQCSGDSSRILSCDRLMDSPLEAAGLNHSSPSQWHQGMVAMLRSLQQTPLQPKGPAGAGSAAGGGAAAAGTPAAAGAISGGSSPAEMAGIKVCSRALRRLQDELERGSAATAAAAAALMAKQQRQQRQGEQRPARQEQQAGGGGQKDSDAQVVPFPAGPPSMAPTVSAAGVASCSTPMVLPLFTTPAAAPGSSRLPAKGSPGSSAAPRNSTTPLALAPQCSSGLASVSLTPAVVTLHTPAGSAAASAVTPRMPAMAWPVQQRADGGFGFVVSAPMTGGGAAAAGTAASTAAAAAASGAVVQLTPAASCTKAGAGTGATPFPPAAVAAIPAAATAGTAGQPWQQATPLSVVNIQPLTLLQSALALQPGAAAATVAGAGLAAAGGAAGVPEQLRSAGVPGGGAAAPAALRDSSHAIRSRLHALIDSV